MPSRMITAATCSASTRHEQQPMRSNSGVRIITAAEEGWCAFNANDAMRNYIQVHASIRGVDGIYSDLAADDADARQES